MIGIVESRADRASTHICERLRELVEWRTVEDDERPAGEGGGTVFVRDGFELRSFDERHLDLVRPADAFSHPPEIVVFASRHSGNTGPLLTGHFTGNVGPAEYGGEDGRLAQAAPNALARLLDAFDEYAPDGYEVGLECTHHGPSDVGAPSLFAELGSDAEQWDDPAGARAVARAILELEGVDPHRTHQFVGFGGGHYVPRFERIVRETPWAVGHVAADWSIESMADSDESSEGRDGSSDGAESSDGRGSNVDRSVVEQAFELSRTDLAVLDGDHPALEAAIDTAGYPVVGETWLRTVGDRSRELVDAVEDALGAIEDGVRFGKRREPSFDVRQVPLPLLEEAQGIDAERTRDVIETLAVAFETTEGGSRIDGHVALPADVRTIDVVEELAEILDEKYDDVLVNEDAVVATRTAFDPALAREAGVPEGPEFGTLSRGEAVTVDGRTVEPSEVTVERTHRFPIDC